LSSRRRTCRRGEAHGKPDGDPASDVEEETSGGGAEREAARDDCRNGKALGDESRAVVDKALALDQGDEPARKAEPLRDRRRRRGSVGDTIAPRTNAVGQLRPGMTA